MGCPRRFARCLFPAASLAVGVLWLVPALRAQQAPPPPRAETDPRARIRATVELVTVPVTVKDSAGELVADLSREEFRVFEDGVEQRLSLFSAEPVPLSAVVLLDNDLKVKAAEAVQESLLALDGAFGEGDEVALARFDSFYMPHLDFTTDRERLFTELKRIQLNRSFPGVGSDPMTAGPRINSIPAPGVPPARSATNGLPTKRIDDALFAAAEALRARDRDRRKVIFIVSDGVNARNNTYSYDNTLQLLLTHGVSVYAIGVDAAVLNRGTSLLARYARDTGGDVFYAARASDLATSYARAGEQARNQYTLGYSPNTPRAEGYHFIEVRVRRPDLTLLARERYYLVPVP